MLEQELKYRLTSPAAHAAIRQRLRELGGEPLGEHQEENWILDDANGALRRRGAVLRVRRLDGGPAGIVTVKGAASFDGGVKTREEREVAVDDAEAAQSLLRTLGYTAAQRYDKSREEWRLGASVVALDRLAFGTFCEIEGPVADIRRLAARLELAEANLETHGYSTLMEQHRASTAG